MTAPESLSQRFDEWLGVRQHVRQFVAHNFLGTHFKHHLAGGIDRGNAQPAVKRNHGGGQTIEQQSGELVDTTRILRGGSALG